MPVDREAALETTREKSRTYVRERMRKWCQALRAIRRTLVFIRSELEPCRVLSRQVTSSVLHLNRLIL